MRIKKTEDIQLAQYLIEKLKQNDGYCPAKSKIPENKCMCLKFLQAGEGPCDCGLYIKTEK